MPLESQHIKKAFISAPGSILSNKLHGLRHNPGKKHVTLICDCLHWKVRVSHFFKIANDAPQWTVRMSYQWLKALHTCNFDTSLGSARMT